MKTRFIFLLLAAMLLGSVSVNAQSKKAESETPQRGDVNGDGKVDVADITAVISIMKNGGSEEAVTGITLDKSSLTLSANGTGTIKATIAPSNATSQGVTWTSDDPSTATVTAVTVSGENATVTWKKAGTVTITAKAVGDDSKKATCTVTCLAEGVVVYYWYVGQTNPLTMTSISPVVTDTSSPGWRLIGTTLPTYSSSNKLFEYVEGREIVTGTSLAKQYIAIPGGSSACPRDGLGNDASTVDMYTRLSNVTISGISYKVYETVGKSKKLAIDIY